MQLIGETELSEFVIKALKDASQSIEQRIEPSRDELIKFV
jgi:hypothetical protein